MRYLGLVPRMPYPLFCHSTPPPAFVFFHSLFLFGAADVQSTYNWTGECSSTTVVLEYIGISIGAGMGNGSEFVQGCPTVE